VKALVLQAPGQVSIETIAKPDVTDADILLKVRIVGFCGRDLNSFRGLNLLVSYPRISGHEVSATVLQFDGTGSKLTVGSNVAVCRYSKCGNLRIISSRARERVPVHPDTRWCFHRIHRDAAKEVVSGRTHVEGVVLGGTIDSRVSCCSTWRRFCGR
jgi:threonine dehydrogenase-like Zn-dependent dehydrogenase